MNVTLSPKVEDMTTSGNAVLKALYPQRSVPRIEGDPLAGLKLWTFFATWQAACDPPQPYEYWSRVRSMVQTMRRRGVDAETIIGKVRAAKWPFHFTERP